MNGQVPHLSGVQEDVGMDMGLTTTIGLITTGGMMLLISPARDTTEAEKNDNKNPALKISKYQNHFLGWVGEWDLVPMYELFSPNYSLRILIY